MLLRIATNYLVIPFVEIHNTWVGGPGGEMKREIN